MDVHHRHKANCQDLLRDLKTTVEGLLVGQLDNVWCVYGGLNRLHNDISRIFENGCKTSANDKVCVLHFLLRLIDFTCHFYNVKLTINRFHLYFRITRIFGISFKV